MLVCKDASFSQCHTIQSECASCLLYRVVKALTWWQMQPSWQRRPPKRQQRASSPLCAEVWHTRMTSSRRSKPRCPDTAHQVHSREKVGMIPRAYQYAIHMVTYIKFDQRVYPNPLEETTQIWLVSSKRILQCLQPCEHGFRMLSDGLFDDDAHALQTPCSFGPPNAEHHPHAALVPWTRYHALLSSYLSGLPVHRGNARGTSAFR